jgi:hypothetical protein
MDQPTVKAKVVVHDLHNRYTPTLACIAGKAFARSQDFASKTLRQPPNEKAKPGLGHF